jgi:hypothetical protein
VFAPARASAPHDILGCEVAALVDALEPRADRSAADGGEESHEVVPPF